MAEFQKQGPRLKSDIIQKLEKPPKDNSSWVVLAVILVMVVLAYAFIIYLIKRDSNPAIIVNQCAPGLCAGNVLTGIKRCPANDTDQIAFSEGIEFCTSKNYCQAKGYTCAVLYDQSLNCAGVCGTDNDQCRCIKNPTEVQ